MSGNPRPKAYAICYLRDVELGDEILEYLERIDATMAPYGGRFLVHGGRVTALEGEWDGDIVILEFPDRAAAEQWYESPVYQEIRPLRTEHSKSVTAIVDGVRAGHLAVDKLAELVPLSANRRG